MAIGYCVHCESVGKIDKCGYCDACLRNPLVIAFIREESADALARANRVIVFPDSRPTRAAPGSPEKIAVLAERYARGVSLFHCADARYEGDTLPDDWVPGSLFG